MLQHYQRSSLIVFVGSLYVTRTLAGFENSLALECESGWRLNEGSCYLMIRTPSSWSKAKESCTRFGGKLAEPDTKQEFEFVKEIMKDFKTELLWLGGTDEGHEGVFVWSSINATITLDMWDTNQPNNENKQNCIEVWPNTKELKWNDWKCGDTRQFICEKQAIQTRIAFVKARKEENLRLPCPIETPLPVDVLSVYWTTPQNANMTIERQSLDVAAVRKKDSGIYVCNTNATTGSRMYVYYVSVTGDDDETVNNCPCETEIKSVSPNIKYENLTHDELVLKLEPVLQELRRNISVNKTKLSSQIRKRTSAPDKRKSSKAIGCIGIMFISIGLGVIVVFDIVSLLRFLGIFRM